MSGSEYPGEGKPYRRVGKLTFDGREVRDLAVAWVVLGVAFALFLNRRIAFALASSPSLETLRPFAIAVVRSLLTVGAGFLLHELAHKVVAVRFDQIAAFRADYGMLGFALLAALGGFLFAAPGAVHHRGRITPRENGLIALAGPVTNIALAIVFFPLAFLPGFLGEIGNLGVLINVVLAAFNMLPVGPLDGRTVLDWSLAAFAITAIPSIGLAVWILFL